MAVPRNRRRWQRLRRLSNMQPFENAYVRYGANGRVFAIVKEESIMRLSLDSVEKAYGLLGQVVEVLKTGKALDGAAERLLAEKLDAAADMILPPEDPVLPATVTLKDLPGLLAKLKKDMDGLSAHAMASDYTLGDHVDRMAETVSQMAAAAELAAVAPTAPPVEPALPAADSMPPGASAAPAGIPDVKPAEVKPAEEAKPPTEAEPPEGESKAKPSEEEKPNREVKPDEAIDKAVWPTAYVNDLPDSAFLFVEPGGEKDSEGKTTPRSLRHFPVRSTDGKLDAAHVRNAISRIPQSTAISEDQKKALQEKARDLLSQIEKTGEPAAPAAPAPIELAPEAAALKGEVAELKAAMGTITETLKELLKVQKQAPVAAPMPQVLPASTPAATVVAAPAPAKTDHPLEFMDLTRSPDLAGIDEYGVIKD